MAKGKKTGGRQKGTPNKVSGALKDAILDAAAQAGGQDGVVGYLTVQASKNPQAFMGLLGRVLPMQVSGPEGAPIQFERIERVIVDPKN